MMDCGPAWKYIIGVNWITTSGCNQNTFQGGDIIHLHKGLVHECMHPLFTFHMVQQCANIHIHEGLVQCTMYMNAYIRFIHFTWYSNVLILTSMKDFLHFIWYSNVLISTSMKDSYMQALPASCWISSTCLAFTGSKSSIPNLRVFI